MVLALARDTWYKLKGPLMLVMQITLSVKSRSNLRVFIKSRRASERFLEVKTVRTWKTLVVGGWKVKGPLLCHGRNFSKTVICVDVKNKIFTYLN